jgi:hypothetical protein
VTLPTSYRTRRSECFVASDGSSDAASGTFSNVISSDLVGVGSGAGAAGGAAGSDAADKSVYSNRVNASSPFSRSTPL